MKILLYFIAFTSVLGAQIFTFTIGSFQMSLFRMGIIGVSSLYLFLGLSGKRRSVLIPSGKNRYSIIFLLLWAIYALISIAWANDYNAWVRIVYFIIIGVLCAVLCSNYLRTREDIFNMLRCLNMGILVQSLIGWYEIFTRNYLFKIFEDRQYDYYVLSGDRIPIAMQGNPNSFAMLMLMGVCLALIGYILSKNNWWKIAYGIMIANYIILLCATRSRGNILALILMGVFLLLYTKKQRVYLFLAIVVVMLSFPISDLLENVLQLQFSSPLSSDTIRLNLIKNGFVFLQDTLGMGTGAGQYAYWMQNYGVFPCGNILSVHNWWMEILFEYGVLIFAGYMMFYYKLYKGNLEIYWSNLSNDATAKISAVICSFIAGYSIGAISASSMITCEWNWLFWGVLIAYQGIKVKKNETKEKKTNGIQRPKVTISKS